MKKRIALLSLLILLALFAGACQNDNPICTPGESEDETGDPTAVAGKGPDPYLDLQWQIHLQELWDYSNSVVYDTLTGTFTIDSDWVLSDYPDTWGPDYLFTISIPAGAVEGQPGTTIAITLLVPTFNRLHNHAVYKLQPDLQFNEPVTVSLCYPFWLDPISWYRKFCFFPISEDPLLMGHSDLQVDRADELGGVIRVTFNTFHFSRWALEEGK